MASVPDEDLVVLVLTDPSAATKERIAQQEVEGEISISTSEIHSWDLPRILRSPVVKVHASRDRLIKESSYFRSLLDGSFSESGLRHVSIQWNLEAVISVLQCIYGFPVNVTSVNILFLFEAALFFGVEILLSECEIWFHWTTSARGAHSLQISLDAIIEIWNFGLEHGIGSIPELCRSYLARNFAWAISCSSFVGIPYDLLYTCIEHPHLTVNSEKQLCEALLVWLTSNTKSSKCSSKSEADYSSILKKVRICLLPLGFAAGQRRNCYFSKFANDSVTAFFDLMTDHPASLLSAITNNDFDNFRIRLTQYSEKLDLSGCAHLTVALLFLVVLPCNLDATFTKRMVQTLIELNHYRGDYYQISEKFTTLSFEAVCEVDMSKCLRVHFGVAINFLHLSFPSLQVLKLSYCSHVKIEDMYCLIQKCPLINDIDFTVDISPVIPTKISILSASSEEYQVSAPYRSLKQKLLSNISKLTLEGRTDLTDFDLLNISALSGSLSYLNLKACTLVSDVGISKLLCECINMHSLVVSYTSFGRNSILALCSDQKFSNGSLGMHHGYNYSCTMAFIFQQLHMDGCKGVEQASMKQLMSHAFMLKSLSLRETALADDALYDFRGSSLENLDVSETMVSSTALSYILRRNPGMMFLKATGCRNLQHSESSVLRFNGDTSCEELYSELGQNCHLKEVAFGWGFSPFPLEKLKPTMKEVRAITVGLGASLGELTLSLLPDICPFLETVILNFQVISDSVLRSILESLRHLQVLGLCCCLGDLTSQSFQTSMPNLRTLRLERVTPWMTNGDLIILTQNFSNLVELSLSGCRLLNSDAQQIISFGWPGLAYIHLEDCGHVTSDGVSFLLDCRAVEDLLLRHNGRGIKRNFIADAISKLPLLRKIALDLCDACEGGFDSPSHTNRFFLSTVKISCCKSQRCGFDLQRSEPFRPVHKQSIVVEWNSKEQRTTIVKERV